ncbi:hypothetical protein C8R45DRAFT_791378, partial [Mycena sanguinolenta]
QMLEFENVLNRTGWTAHVQVQKTRIKQFAGTRWSGAQWRSKLKALRTEMFAAKFRNAPSNLKSTAHLHSLSHIEGVTVLPASYFTKSYVAKQIEAGKHAQDTINAFNLNVEQERAFRIVANHSLEAIAEPLRMYLGGVGGTGKSQVIKALIHFFESRSEAYKFLVLAPTGTAAALLGGST